MKYKTEQFLYGTAVAVVFAVIAGIAYYTWTLGSDEDDYHIVCISGHEYYRANFAYKMAVSIKLNDDGKPVKCKSNE